MPHWHTDKAHTLGNNVTVRSNRPQSSNAASVTAIDSEEWDIGGIVASLKRLRDASLAARQRVGRPVKLPSRKALSAVVDGLSTALFPNRLSSRALAEESVDYFVGHTLDVALRDLVEQIDRELLFHERDTEDYDASGERDRERRRVRSVAIVREFAERLPEVRGLLESDIVAAFEGDPAARSVDEVLACYPGVTAMVHPSPGARIAKSRRHAHCADDRRSRPFDHGNRHSSRRDDR